MRGQIRYLHGIDWDLVDGLADRQREIRARTLLIWGADDPTFRVIPRGKLLVHEEFPDAVASELLGFLVD